MREKRLSIGIAHTRDFLPEEIGRNAQIEETGKAVDVAMRDAGIDDPHDVHFVQIKCPLLTSERIEAASGRGNKTVTAIRLHLDGLFARRLGARRRSKHWARSIAASTKARFSKTGICFRRSPRLPPASS